MFELTTAVLLLAQAFSPVPTVTKDNTEAVQETEEARQEITVVIEHSLTLEEYVRETFKDTPVLAEVAYCESRFRQFNDNGTVLRGKVNKGDIGIMQINKYYHEEDALKLGLDIYTIDGNLEYAKHLYEKDGSDPWVHSSKCWKHLENSLAKK